MALLFGVVPSGCDSSSGGSSGGGISNINQSAPRLEERDENGNYRPYYATGEMVRPRYLHEALFSSTGFVIIFGGTDERGVSSLDTVEFYDQSLVERDVPAPESETGVWFDTNFQGDPMVMETGSRMLFTVTELANGEVVIIGGTSDLLRAGARPKGELFDPATREFETIDEEMKEPRFRHTTIRLNTGALLITGGQIESSITLVEELVFANIQQNFAVFPSTASNELYLPTENLFETFTLPNSDREVRLSTPRGRAGHAIQRMAGPDLTLRSGDDVFVIAGGFQTLSPAFAPLFKFRGRVGDLEADGLKSVEFFDPGTNTFSQIGNITLNSPRIDTPFVLNMGHFNDFTIDGVPGLGNAIVVTHGNSDGGCEDTIANIVDEVFLATFTGFGPVQGIQFFTIEDNENMSRIQGVEYSTDLAPVLPTFPPAPFPVGQWIGRCWTNPVAMPRRMTATSGDVVTQTWFFTLAGAHNYPVPGGCIYQHSTVVLDAGSIFDPFYSLPAARIGLSTRDLNITRTLTNPLGVVGCWLVVDGDIPTIDTMLLGTTPVGRWAQKIAPGRAYPKNIAIPGEDGVIETADDRILMTGGGSDGGAFGDEPASPSTEIFLPPRLNDRTPWD